MTPALLWHAARANARQMLWIYLALIGVAEYVTAAVNPIAGLALHASVLVGLVFHATFATEPAARPLMGALTLAPLIRLLSLSLPLTSLRQVYWYPVVAVPLLIAAFLVIWQSRMPRAMLGLRRGSLPLQLMVMTGGVGLGVLEYAILQPAPLIRPFGWLEVAGAALVLLIFTGFTEELIFRGVFQSLAIPVLGRWSLIYVALLFAVLHIGYLSLFDVVFVFAVGWLFAYIVYWSGSILGVTLAHGLTNIFLFLVMPYLAEDLSAQLDAALPWVVGVTAAASIGAIVTLALRARREGRFGVGAAPVAPPLGAPADAPAADLPLAPAPVAPPLAAPRAAAIPAAQGAFVRLGGQAQPLLQIRVEDAALGLRAQLFVAPQRMQQADQLEVYVAGERAPELGAGLLPPQYGFVAGVVELDGLPAGEKLTSARRVALHLAGRLLAKRLRSELDALASADPEAFQQFWRQYGDYFGVRKWNTLPSVQSLPA